jgi:integrase/recombinase XerD
LFLNAEGDRLDRGGILRVVRQAAERVGLHDSSSEGMENHFSPHCCRHWNTTHLLRAGMKREYVQWLHGDAIKGAVDIYFHIDPKDVQVAYLASIPQLGI